MPSQMLESLLSQTKKLGKIELQISAKGVYPGKRNTKVQNVAVYQNDGTEHIKASNFVDRAARIHREWTSPLQRAVGKWLSGNERELSRVGQLIAKNINEKVDRIKTRRLKHSFRHIIKKI
ncbi:hypothetical protein KAR91_53370 [Candidatus Pacearchaeota archaeon]|nr:hypothetical protein [Candidatus Pacearchaeota archaeon]